MAAIPPFCLPQRAAALQGNRRLDRQKQLLLFGFEPVQPVLERITIGRRDNSGVQRWPWHALSHMLSTR